MIQIFIFGGNGIMFKFFNTRTTTDRPGSINHTHLRDANVCMRGAPDSYNMAHLTLLLLYVSNRVCPLALKFMNQNGHNQADNHGFYFHTLII